MANILPTEEQIAIIGALAEGSGIRSIERLNATTRLHVKRLSRLTLASSKKLETFKAAVGPHFAYYNCVRRHNTLRCTPAIAAGIEKELWSVAA